VIGQAETEAKRFKHQDIAAFAKTIRSEIEEKIEGMSKQELVSPDFLLKLVHEKAGVDDPQEFFEHLHDTGILIKKSLLADGKFPRSSIYTMGYFMLKWHETANDQSYTNLVSRYVSKEGIPSARLEIVALDPSKTTLPVFSSVYASVIMSGTLQPMEAYVKITGLPEDTVITILPSPFPKEHILPLISCGVTTAMEKRTPEMYKKITQKLKEIVANTPANTGIFVPSFQVLNALLASGLKNGLNKSLYCEHRNMTSRENEGMVAEFKERSKHAGAVLLGVQGGRSSEGVDFPGDEMNSVAIVGLPYAEPTPKVKAQIDYFENRFPGCGREYGYVLPAMKKASQAAGRPIRTPDDKGAMIFLDHRFSSAYCRRFLPAWIQENLEIVQDEDGAIATKLKEFFKRVC
jgi:DNA excision repair protein ERCC-2